MDFQAIAAFDTNYLWLGHRAGEALVVDPGDAEPVRRALVHGGLRLAGILVTHHHADHTGGVAALVAEHGCPVWGPAFETLPFGCTRVQGGDTVQLLGCTFDVIDVPGHTAGHVAYHCSAHAALFCGDTLFSAGCGRLFEGTPAQMLASLDTLAALPAATRVFCAHEYTLDNLRFAAAADPGNADTAAHAAWCRQQRAQGLPTLPSTLDTERRINPFLRSREPAVRGAVAAHAGAACGGDAGWFAALRRWKDDFR